MLLHSCWVTSVVTSFIYFFYIFFSLFKLLFPLFSKKKTFLLPISSYTYCYISSNLSLTFLPLYLPTILLLYFLMLFYNLPILLLLHLLSHFFQHFPFLFASLSPNYFTIILPSSFFYNLPLLLLILFCINLMLSSHSIHIFPTQNCEYSLSLSVNFYSFL